jgi:hypothetical protein
MNNREIVKKVLLVCIEAHNEQVTKDRKVPLEESTLLLAEGSFIDSIELVNIIVDFEEALAAEFGKIINLTSDDSMTKADTPFYNIGALCNYAYQLTM